MAKDLNSTKVSKEIAKGVIQEALEQMQGQKFKGAVGMGEAANEYTMPESIEAAQAKEKEFRDGGNTREAGQFAQGFLGTIAQKLIYQTISGATIDNEDMSFIDRFRGEIIEYGVGKEYNFVHMSGSEEENFDQFVPTAPTKETVINQVNTFLKPDNSLNKDGANAFMRKFTLSITTFSTKEYMLSDVKLQQFIQKLRDGLVNGAKQYVYNLIFDKLITASKAASVTPDGQKLLKIEGTKTNMFDACIEVCQHIRKLCKTGSRYQLIQTNGDSPENYVRSANLSDLVWIWSINNDELADRGIKSQLYQAKLWDPNSQKGISDSNVYTPGTKINLPDLTTSKANNYPKDSKEEWIDDNTIIVLENGALEYNVVWDKTESQYYTNNMTLQITYHLAGMVNFIKTMRGFVYTNANLNRLPDGQ